jgi:hypothetical protein
MRNINILSAATVEFAAQPHRLARAVLLTFQPFWCQGLQVETSQGVTQKIHRHLYVSHFTRFRYTRWIAGTQSFENENCLYLRIQFLHNRKMRLHYRDLLGNAVRKVIAIYSENHNKLPDTFCGHIVDLLNVSVSGTYAYYSTLKGTS